MEEVTLEEPDEQDVIEWEQEALNDFRASSKWIGSPDYSVEAYLVNSNRPIEADNINRLEPQVVEAEILMTFRDVNLNEWVEILKDEEFIREQHRLGTEMSAKGFMDMSVYMSRIHDAAPREIDGSYFSTDAELGHLTQNMSVAEEIESIIEESRDFALTGVKLSAMSKSEDPLKAFYDLEAETSFEIHFRYAGDKDAVDRFNELMAEYGRDANHCGVPGTVVVGQGKSYAHLPYSSDIGLTYAEVEEKFRDELSDILAAREGIEKK